MPWRHCNNVTLLCIEGTPIASLLLYFQHGSNTIVIGRVCARPVFTPYRLLEEENMKGAYQFTNYNGINPWLMPEGTRQYAELKSLLRQKGFFEKQPRYYIWKIVFTLGLLVSSGACLLLTKHVEIQL